MGRRRQVESESLREVTSAAKSVERAEAERAQAIFVAHEAGNGLRVIASAAGVSHETVRGIIGQEAQREASVREQLERPIAALSMAEHEREESRRRRLAGTVKQADEKARQYATSAPRELTTDRQRQLANAAKTRVEKLVGYCNGIARGSHELKIELAAAVSEPDEIQGWEEAATEAVDALALIRQRAHATIKRSHG